MNGASSGAASTPPATENTAVTRHDHYTHGHAAAVLQAHSRRTVEDSLAYGLAYLRPGMTVLDLGCGVGTITVGIAERVAPGWVIAADIHPGVIDQARQYARTRGVTNIDFQVMDAYHLDLADTSIDFAHAHQVLQHVSDPVAVLREMARVTKPGGIVAARDGDYESFTWYPADAGIEQWLRLYRTAARANDGEPDAGRHLLAWAHAAGLTQVIATSSNWTYSGETAQWWGSSWADRIQHSDLTRQLTESGLATMAEIESMAQSWLDWSTDPDAWFMLPNGEILATKQ